MFKASYDPGDKTWIALHGSDKLHPGKVRLTVQFKEHPAVFYIIKLDDPEWPVHEVRDALLMSATAEGPLGYWTVLPRPTT